MIAHCMREEEEEVSVLLACIIWYPVINNTHTAPGLTAKDLIRFR